MKRPGWLGVVIAMQVVAAADPAAPPLVGPAPEVIAKPPLVVLPKLPTFELPGGALTVARLRADRKAFLGKHVVLRGVITYAYDCLAELRQPGETTRHAQARIDADPTLCERPKFYVGDAAGTSPDRSLWVVDVPRVYNKLELSHIAKADRTLPGRCEPGERDPTKRICPPYRDGDQVIVAGTFALTSPHGEANSDGLLVYEGMQNVTRRWKSPGFSSAVTHVGALGAAQPLAPLPALPRPAVTAPVSMDVRDRSIALLDRGNRALTRHDVTQAHDLLAAAVASWDGNHLAWYGLGIAALEQADFDHAVTALDRCVALVPDQAMYEMFDGIARFDQAVNRARQDQAALAGRRPDQIDPDLSAADFSRAELALRQALKLAPGLWRAHYYLSRIARARDDARYAARELDEAIHAKPSEWAPYVGLGELLLKWDYFAQAIEVAEAGTHQVTDRDGLSDLYYVVGMGHDAKHEDRAAIDAFTHALDLRPAHAQARYQRGQSYYRMGDYANARADLEQFLKAQDAKLAFARAQANKMLIDIAARAAQRK